MATITKGYIFGSTELVTNTKLHVLVDDATISGITSTDMDFSNSAATNYLVGWDGSKFNFMAQQSLVSLYIPPSDSPVIKEFTNGSLVSYLVSVYHGLGQKVVDWDIANNIDEIIIPDKVKFLDTNNIQFDFTSYGSLVSIHTARIRK